MEEISIQTMVNRLFAMQRTHSEEINRRLPVEIGNAAQNLFVENFNKQGFDTGNGIKKWLPRKSEVYSIKSRKNISGILSEILVRTGRGRRDVANSMRTPRVSTGYIVIPFEVADDYMGYHNYGTDKIPQREFMGDSDALHRIGNEKIEESYNRILTAK